MPSRGGRFIHATWWHELLGIIETTVGIIGGVTFIVLHYTPLQLRLLSSSSRSIVSSTVSTEVYLTFQIMIGSHVTVPAGLLGAVDEVIE